MEKRKTEHVPEVKKNTVNEFAKLIEDYPIVGAVNMENLPAPQLQKMREQLRSQHIILKMTKRRLLKLAIEKVKDKKKGIDKLEKELLGMPAVIFTKENPFKLFKFLQKNKSNAPAKAGQTAPFDLKVSAGATPFAPGPIIGELGALKIKTGVENGKVVIKQDSIVVHKGDKVTQKAAEVLTRLGIEPMEIGLDLVAVYEEGEIFGRDLLSVDEAAYISNITQAATWAMNLAVEAVYASKDTAEILLQKAFREAKAVPASGIMGDILAKADRQAMALKTEFNIQ